MWGGGQFFEGLLPGASVPRLLLKETHAAKIRARHTVDLCEEVACSWRRLNQQEKPDITRQQSSCFCKDIVRELLEGQKTGRSSVETAVLFKVHMHERK